MNGGPDIEIRNKITQSTTSIRTILALTGGDNNLEKRSWELVSSTSSLKSTIFIDRPPPERNTITHDVQ